MGLVLNMKKIEMNSLIAMWALFILILQLSVYLLKKKRKI